VLRALAGTAVLPRMVLELAGAAYAMGWAMAAVRNVRRFAGGFYAATSALMLGPMLWEMCLRFQAMQPSVAAAILAANLVAVVIAARGNYRSPAFSFVFAGSAVTALALCIGTHSMMGFIAILLAMTLFGEFNRLRGEALPVAAFVALTADAAIWALLFIYRAPAAARPEYPALSPATVLAAPLLLFLVQTAAVANQTCIRKQRVAFMDALQIMASFLLFALGAFWIVPWLVASAVGSLCLVLCAGCYWAAYDPAMSAIHPRNYGLFTTWALLLLIAGLFLLLPATEAAVALSVAVIVAIGSARALGSMLLQFHALVYLVVGVIACGLPQYEGNAVIANAPSRPAWSMAIVAALCIAAFFASREGHEEGGGLQSVHFVFALLATCAACAFLTHGLLAAAGMAFHPEAFHIALLRTLAICAAALALALGGVHLRRAAMTRVAYVLLAFVVLKLVFEDLRHGHLAFLAGSIGMVAVTLIAVPRIAARGPVIKWSGGQVNSDGVIK
jgi:hypothetical protein